MGSLVGQLWHLEEWVLSVGVGWSVHSDGGVFGLCDKWSAVAEGGQRVGVRKDVCRVRRREKLKNSCVET